MTDATSILYSQEGVGRREADFLAFKDVKVAAVTDFMGEFSYSLQNEHFFSVSPKIVTVVPTSENGSKFRENNWAPGTIGYIPPNLLLDGVVQQKTDTIFVIMADGFFRRCAYETVDHCRIDYRYLYGESDTIAYSMVQSLGHFAADNDNHGWPMLVESIGTALAVRVMQILGAQPMRFAPYPNGLPSERMRRALDYIHDNLHTTIRLADLAAIAAMSPFHFSRAFRRTIGVTPVRYVWRCRIDLAKSRLRDQSIPLAVIALECGFASQAHFTTLFRQLVGVTPSRYRAGV